jgi:adenylate kinase
MHLILLGAPGAGKGTQGTQLAERLGVPKIATGDILRAAVREGTELGLEAKRYMDAGELVPDEVILGLVREALADSSAASGALFDGFPRNISQAERLSEILTEADRRLDGVVVLEVPDEAIVERMSGRRSDPETGEVYHLKFNPPPPQIAARLIQREDDKEGTVRHRLSVYAAQTAPLIEHYERQGVPLHRVDGTGKIEQIQQRILQSLGG